MSNFHPRPPSTTSSVTNKLAALKLDDMSEAGSTSGHRRSSSSDATKDYKDRMRVEAFHGERSQLRRFLIQLKVVFVLERDKYPTSQSQVLFASMQLKGAAFSWFEPYISDYLTGKPNNDTQKIFSAFGEFEDKIKQVFNVSDEERVAAIKLRQLRQRGSAAQYYSQFQQLIAHLDWDNNAKRAAYYDGLSDAIKDKMVPEPPEELQELIDVSIKIDNRLYERRMERGGGYRTMPRFSKSNHDYGDPIELDAMRAGRPSRTQGRRP